MKKICIVAKERIINPSTGKIHSDDGLRALDGYFEDVIEVDDNYNEISLLLQYEEEHPEIKGWNFQITEIH